MHPIKITALLACTVWMFGQGTMAQGPSFGIKGGLSHTNLAGVDADDHNARIGFHAGLFGRTAPSAPVGLQMELLYSTKGNHTKYNAFFGLIDQEVDFNLNYLEVPVLASIRLAEVLEFQVGGYAAYLLSAKASTSGDLVNASDELDRDRFRSVDAGVAAGIGLNAGESLQVGLRYLHGLSDVIEDKALHDVVGDARNRCLQLYLAIGVGGH